MAQQSHSLHVAQDYLCDIGLAIAISHRRERGDNYRCCNALLFNGSTPMTKQTTPLRQRMLDAMAFRNMSASTQQCYSYAVAGFARYHQTLVGSASHPAIAGRGDAAPRHDAIEKCRLRCRCLW